MTNTMESLITAIYPDIQQGQSSRSILFGQVPFSLAPMTMWMSSTLFFSQVFLDQSTHSTVQTQSHYRSMSLNNYQPYPTEYLNSLRASGLPLSKLGLKLGGASDAVYGIWMHLRGSVMEHS